MMIDLAFDGGIVLTIVLGAPVVLGSRLTIDPMNHYFIFSIHHSHDDS